MYDMEKCVSSLYTCTRVYYIWTCVSSCTTNVEASSCLSISAPQASRLLTAQRRREARAAAAERAQPVDVPAVSPRSAAPSDKITLRIQMNSLRSGEIFTAKKMYFSLILMRSLSRCAIYSESYILK